jgi:diguanylate cyclase (GGDEF)-like protein/PAS domain S-box-containing protein
MLYLFKLQTGWPTPLRYLIALMIFVAALLLRFAIATVEAGFPFVTFYPALFIGFYLCGVGPGTLVVVLSSLAAYYLFIPPFRSFTVTPEGNIAILTYVISACMVGWLIHMQKALEKKTGELNNDFISFLENTSDFIYYKDINSRFRFCSQALANITGHNSWRDMIGKHDLEVFPEDTAKIYCEEEVLIFREGIPLLNKTDPYYDAEKNKGWVRTSKWPLRDGQGKVCGLFGISRDVTEIKAAEDALRESENRYRGLVEDQTEIICRFKADGTLLFVNDAFCRLFGMQREALLGEKWQLIAYEEDFPLINQKLNSLSPANPVITIENRIYTAGGAVRWAQFINRAFFDEQGHLHELQAVGRDITEQKIAEDKLRKLTKEQQVMLDTEFIGIVKLRNRNTIWVNKAMHRIFGYEPGEFYGQSSRILYADEQSFQAMGESAYPILKAVGIFRTQTEMVRKNGDKIWIDLSGTLLSEEDGESLWTMVDITLLKEHEAQVESIAYHDVLTGLPNRLLVADRLNQALAQTNRAKRMLAVGYLDLDGFKPINDKFGHEAGDKVLIEVAKRMENIVRNNDTVGRLGGDEFVLLLSELGTAEEYQVVLQRILESINMPIALSDSINVSVGVSIGVTLFPADGDDPDTLLRHADQAMYRAKQMGRNRICQFTGDDYLE